MINGVGHQYIFNKFQSLFWRWNDTHKIFFRPASSGMLLRKYHEYKAKEEGVTYVFRVSFLFVILFSLFCTMYMWVCVSNAVNRNDHETYTREIEVKLLITHEIYLQEKMAEEFKWCSFLTHLEIGAGGGQKKDFAIFLWNSFGYKKCRSHSKTQSLVSREGKIHFARPLKSAFTDTSKTCYQTKRMSSLRNVPQKSSSMST